MAIEGSHPATAAARRNLPRAALAALAAHHVWLWLAIVLSVLVVGTLGYLALGWSPSDAMYMTIISLTTVGYKEVRDLDDVGRFWTGIVAVAGVGVIFGTIGIVVESLVTEVTSGKREQRRMRAEIDRLQGHYIVCGYGRVGSTVARELDHAGQQVVVIDVNAPSIARARENGLLAIDGDATADETLRAAGIERAAGLITTIDSDANNVFVVLSARALSPALFILGRANLEGSEAKILQAGANRAVSPYEMAGRRIAELATRPRVAEFLDAALSHAEERFTIDEVLVRPGGPLDGETVGSLRERGIFTLAVVTKDGYEAHPADDRVLRAGEGLVVSGAAEPLKGLDPGG
jgi:voltage-gated potassium channel